MAASVLGAAEIAYHAQSAPALPALRRRRRRCSFRARTSCCAAPPSGAWPSSSGSRPRTCWPSAPPRRRPSVPQADAVARARGDDRRASSRRSSRASKELDPTLAAASRPRGKKIAYQFEQLAERARKAVERKSDVDREPAQTTRAMLRPERHPGRADLPAAAAACSLRARSARSRSGGARRARPPERPSSTSAPRRQGKATGRHAG